MIPAGNTDEINNRFYDFLGERWYSAMDDPVALLRAEAEVRDSWVIQGLGREFGSRPLKILDIGCGAGFLANALAVAGHQVNAMDSSRESLDVARRHDRTGSVVYEHGDARQLTYPSGFFNAVCAMDFLEHVEDPSRIIAEASRVLAPGGLFFFHTLNRNPVAWLIVIKGIEWFVNNAPKNMHLYRLFIRPGEMVCMCEMAGLEVVKLAGVGPKLFSSALLTLIRTGVPPADFKFSIRRSRLIGYIGYARKGA